MVLDGTNLRAHQKTAGAARKAGRHGSETSVRRSRGRYGTKACVMVDGGGRAMAFRLAPE